MRLSDEFISEVKYRNDIAEIASGYMTLKRRGRNLVGLCPFHGEKTPSFNIYTENGSFYCFGCGAGGDVITFIMKIENLDYMEAIKFLAQRAGMAMPEDSYDDSMGKLRNRVFEANREAARFFYSQLYTEGGKNALSYLRSRGLKESTIRHFGLGYSPDSRFALSNHLKSKGFTDAELISANLVYQTRSGKGVTDRFYNRVMFPIIDLRGNVIAFGGRIMSDQKPKYLNTSDTLAFSKSHNLFSLNNAKNSGSKSLILCEGYMDVIAINQAGFQNAVATLGTALTSEQAVLMKRYCNEVVICYDSDEAGQKATARAIPILRNAGLVVRVLTIPDGKDPDEFIKKNGENGPAAFKNILENTGNDIDYQLFKLKSRYDMENTQDKLSFLTEAVKLLSTLDNSIEQDVYASKLANDVSVDKSSIMEQLKKAVRKNYSTKRKKDFSNMQKSISARDDVINPQKKEKLRASCAEENLIAYLVNNPDKLPYIEKHLSKDEFVTDFSRNLYEYFFERIKENKDPLTTVSKDFSPDEISRVYQIVSSYASVSATDSALDEYIKIIKDESSKPSKADIASASDEQMKDFFKNLRDSHK